jgi:hypothetical protein
MKNLRLLIALSLISFTFLSCSKKEEGPSLTEILIGTEWKFNGYVAEPKAIHPNTGEEISNLYPFLYPCDQDDIWGFNEDGTFYFDDNTTKCQEDGPQVYAKGDWHFNGEEELILKMEGESYGIFYSITEINESNIKLSASEVIWGQSTTTIRTFVPAN